MSLDDRAMLALALGESERRTRAEPLARMRAASWAAEEYVAAMERGLDCYAHGGNGSGKSYLGGAYELAKLTGLDHLLARDGTPMPVAVLEPPVSWGLGVPTYKLAEAGAIGALRAMLGDWPYRAVNNSSGTESLVIWHRGAPRDDESRWSRLYVYPYDGPEPEGPRLDGFRCDEPPPLRHLDALRTRRKAGRMFHRSLTVTPIDKRTWGPIRDQYPGPALVEDGGRYRIQWAVWDNEAMSADQIESILREWRWGEPGMRAIARARILGEHVDDSGSAPWDAEVFERWRARAREPRVEQLVVQREVEQGGGRRLKPIACELRVYADSVPGEVYFVVSDHGKGIRDGKHDPDVIHVYAMRRKALVAVVSEYLGGWGNGLASVALARRYNGATWYPLVTGGYAESALSAARTEGFYSVGRARVNEKPGQESGSLGINETVALRNMAIGALEQAMAVDGVLIEDAEVLDTLAGCVIDVKGKIVGGPESGWHDEHLVCAGVGCHLLGNRKPPAEPKRSSPQGIEAIERAMGLPRTRPQRKQGLVIGLKW